MMPSNPVLVLRLLPDDSAMQLLVPSRLGALPDLHARLCRECERLGIAGPPPSSDLSSILGTSIPGQWLTVVAAQAPLPPQDERIEVLTALPVAALGSVPRSHRMVVRQGDVLARRVPGQPGKPGCSLRRGEIPPRPPKQAALPSGEHTTISEDGLTLYAACDGEAVFQHSRIDVQPVLIHDGDVAPHMAIESRNLPVFITGSVAEGARISADAGIFIGGNVLDAQLTSRSAGVTVAGMLTGSPQHRARIRSAGVVGLDQARLAAINSTGDVHIRNQAWQCSISTAGNLYVAGSMQDALQHVELDVKGVVRSPLGPPPPARGERQFIRVPCSMAATFACLALASPAFFPCTMVDISPGGVRCRFGGGLPRPQAGDLLQLRFALPGATGNAMVIGRAMWTAEGTAGVQFLQHTRQDHDRISAYCRALLTRNPSARLTSPSQRAKGASLPV
jgi:hypothetical protein